LCPHCKKIKKLSEKEEKKVKEVLSGIKNKNVKIPENLIFYESSGCEKCSQIGYKGRIGLYESIEMLPNIKKLIQQEHITDYEIEELAIENGTVTMLQDGVLKALNGDTSLEEVFRVL
jgi:type II secretory ATPase GspE/PulE/Tfp pilus assembly ATPase PilB-like protein